MIKCKHKDCQKSVRSRGWCVMHYKRWLKGTDMDAPPQGTVKFLCKHKGCNKPRRYHGWCKMHADRAKKGNPMSAPLRQIKPIGATMLSTVGYIKLKIANKPGDAGKNWRAQHIHVMEQYLGRKMYPNESVHHRNGIRNDNRLSNLELWASAQPAGQRVSDLVKFAHEILERYPE